MVLVNIIDLKTSITNVLKTIPNINGKVFEYSHVNKDEPVHYITYNVKNGSPGTTDERTNKDFILNVAILDHNEAKDTAWVENKLNEVVDSLEGANIIESDFYYQTVVNSIDTDLPTTDEFTFRREVNFLLRTYLK